MSDAVLNAPPSGEGLHSTNWIGGAVVGVSALALAAWLVAVRYPALGFTLAPLQTGITFSAIAALVCLGVAFDGLAGRAPSPWTLAPASAMLLVAVPIVGAGLLAGKFAAWLPFALLGVALLPAAAAVVPRLRLDLSRQTAARRAIASASAIACAQLAALCFIASDRISELYRYPVWAYLIAFAWAAIPVLVTTHAAAQRERKLPLVFNPNPPYGHISSLGALTLVAFVALIAALGLWSASHGLDARISQNTGLGTVGGLVVTFALVAVLPTSRRANKALEVLNRSLEKALGGFSKAFSALDGALVFAVAPVVGATQPKRLPRYGLLFGWLVALGWLGWLLPAPFGLVPLISAFVAVVAVARRWAWVEEDRENAMLNRKFRGDHIRIGFSNDLRDEALLGFMSLFVIVPLALRQLHIADGGTMFVINEATNADDVWAWIGFFGAELAKAVPFVDWAEIYQVKGAAPISMDETDVGDAQHAVFATRVVVDLVFLAALLQAISALQRSAKLKTMFEERGIDWLDPFAEGAAFRDLAVAHEGGWKLADNVPTQFWDYDEDRLVELAAGNDEAIAFVAQAIIDRNAERLPEQVLVDEAKLEEPDPAKLEAVVTRVRDERPEPDVGSLKLAHIYLNSHSKAWSVRAQVVQLIADHWRLVGAVDALCGVLIPGAARDGRAEVRLIALAGLYKAALVANDESARRIIRWAAANGNDASTKVSAAATDMLRQNPGWDEGGEGDAPPAG